MTFEEYVKNVLKTESCNFVKIRARLSYDEDLRLLHSVLGLCTESGELVDSIKKHIFYNKDLDLVNVEEELGDIMWYFAVACNVLGFNLSDIMEKNIKKLEKRYGKKFSEEKANNRDINNELSHYNKIKQG